MPEETETHSQPRDPLFPATMWSAVLEAREADTPHALQALERLARAYWRPLYIFLRQRGREHEMAEEEVQGFFAHLLSRDFLRFVQPGEGKFRTFLLTSFTRWLNDQGDRARAAKRGGGVTPIPLPEFDSVRELAQPASETPEMSFDRRWAREIFERAMQRVGEAWSIRGALFIALRPTIAGESVAEDAKTIREGIRLTVRDDAAVDDELRYLIRLLRQ